MKPSFFERIIIKFLILLSASIGSHLMFFFYKLYVLHDKPWRNTTEGDVYILICFIIILIGLYYYWSRWKHKHGEMLILIGMFSVIHFFIHFWIPNDYEKVLMYDEETVPQKSIMTGEVFGYEPGPNSYSVLVTKDCESIELMEQNEYEFQKPYYSLRLAVFEMGFDTKTMCFELKSEPNKFFFGIGLLFEMVFYSFGTIFILLILILLWDNDFRYRKRYNGNQISNTLGGSFPLLLKAAYTLKQKKA